MSRDVDEVKAAIAAAPDEFYGRVLKTPVKPDGSRWRALCPLHPDRDPSLTIYGDGRYWCFGCGAAGDGIALIRAMRKVEFKEALAEARRVLGMRETVGRGVVPRPADHQSNSRGGVQAPALQNGNGQGKGTSTVYALFDGDGQVVAEHVRTDYPDGSKDLHWRSNGQAGLAGMKACDLPLYGLPGLADLHESEPVFVTEGEKAADAIIAAGRVAVGTVCGASSIPADHVLAPLREGIVILWPDHDAPGREHMRRLGERLVELREGCHPEERDSATKDLGPSAAPQPQGDKPEPPGTGLYVLPAWDGAPDCGDAHDFLATHTPQEFEDWWAQAAVPFVEWAAELPTEKAPGEVQAPAPQVAIPDFIWASELDGKIAPPSWVWPGWILKDYVTLIAAEPKSGKSMLALWLAHVYLEGLPWPDGTEQEDTQDVAARRVLWLEADAARDLTYQRMKDFGIDRSRIAFLGADGLGRVNVNSEAELAGIGELARCEGCGLIILDTLAGSHSTDENTADMGKLIASLADTAREAAAAFVVTHHLRKRGTQERGSTPLDRVRGSSAIGASVRSLIWIDKMSDHACVTRPECNNAGSLDYHLRMTIGDTALQFERVAAAGEVEAGRLPFQWQRAAEFLRKALDGGPRSRKELFKESKAEGISDDAMYYAFPKLGLRSTHGHNCMWYEAGNPPPEQSAELPICPEEEEE